MTHQIIRVEQFPGLNGFLLVLVGIERRNALFGRTVLFVGKARLLEPVEIPVVISDGARRLA